MFCLLAIKYFSHVKKNCDDNWCYEQEYISCCTIHNVYAMQKLQPFQISKESTIRAITINQEIYNSLKKINKKTINIQKEDKP